MSNQQEQYFETVEDRKEADFKRGDVVRMYKEGNHLEYPCLIMSYQNLESFRVDALKAIVRPKGADNSTPDGYTVYIHLQNQLVDIGMVTTKRLRHLLDEESFKVFTKEIYLDAQSESIEGEMLYALCAIPD